MPSDEQQTPDHDASKYSLSSSLSFPTEQSAVVEKPNMASPTYQMTLSRQPPTLVSRTSSSMSSSVSEPISVLRRLSLLDRVRRRFRGLTGRISRRTSEQRVRFSDNDTVFTIGESTLEPEEGEADDEHDAGEEEEEEELSAFSQTGRRDRSPSNSSLSRETSQDSVLMIAPESGALERMGSFNLTTTTQAAMRNSRNAAISSPSR